MRSIISRLARQFSDRLGGWDEQALWRALLYCAGHDIPLWEWLANEHRSGNRIEVRPNWKEKPGMLDWWEARSA